MSEKKVKSWDRYVFMYECGQHFLYSTYERAWEAHGMTISKMKDIVEI